MPKQLDVFCCAGLAQEGYERAGWDTEGWDNDPVSLKYNPYKTDVVDINSVTVDMLKCYDLITGSPPCQAHSDLKHRTGKDYVDLIPQTRELFIASGKPYIIENVESVNDHLINPITLCGTMFGLSTRCTDGIERELRRHRLFESNMDLTAPGPCQHNWCGPVIGVYGDGGGGQQTRGYKAFAAEGRAVMGIDRHVPRRFVSQGLPPVYTEYLGRQARDIIGV